MRLRPIRTEADYNRRRRLTIEMAWRLHRELGIPAEAVIKPYALAARSCAAGRR